MASSQSSDVELITFNFIRNHYEKKFKQNVPMALKYLIIQFSNRVIGCKLLSIKQDMEFVKLLSTKIPSIRRFNFLFRASDHQYSAKKFHEYVDNKPGTISIIQSNWGNIFGGYTSKSWRSDVTKVFDKNYFLFLIKSDDELIDNKCPLLLEPCKDARDICIRHHPRKGPWFGQDIWIDDHCDKKVEKNSRAWEVNYTQQCSYDTPPVNLCGGKATDGAKAYMFQVIDYEVFQIN